MAVKNNKKKFGIRNDGNKRKGHDKVHGETIHLVLLILGNKCLANCEQQ